MSQYHEIKLYYMVNKQLDAFQLQHNPVCYQYLPVCACVVDVDGEVTVVTVEGGVVGLVDPSMLEVSVCDDDWVGVVEV